MYVSCIYIHEPKYINTTCSISLVLPMTSGMSNGRIANWALIPRNIVFPIPSIPGIPVVLCLLGSVLGSQIVKVLRVQLPCHFQDIVSDSYKDVLFLNSLHHTNKI